MQVLASQLHFLTNRNAELAIPPLFWPVNCIKIGGHVAPLSCPSIYFLFYATTTHNRLSLLIHVVVSSYFVHNRVKGWLSCDWSQDELRLSSCTEHKNITIMYACHAKTAEHENETTEAKV